MDQTQLNNRIVNIATERLELVTQLARTAPQGPLPVEVIDQPVLVPQLVGEQVVAKPVIDTPVVDEPVITTPVVIEKPVFIEPPVPVVKPIVTVKAPVSVVSKPVRDGVISADELDRMFEGVS